MRGNWYTFSTQVAPLTCDNSSVKDSALTSNTYVLTSVVFDDLSIKVYGWKQGNHHQGAIQEMLAAKGHIAEGGAIVNL